MTSLEASGGTGDPVRPSIDAGETLDLLFDGRVALIQARHGYRTSVDSLLLAAIVAKALADDAAALALLALGAPIVDLGAGSGLVSLLLGLGLPAAGLPRPRLWLVEQQPQLAGRAMRSLTLHGLAGTATQDCRDLAEPWPDPPRAAVVVCNPPYYRAAARTLPRDPERRVAHYEGSAPLERFAEVAAGALAQGGLCAFVFPFEGHARLLRALAAAGLGTRTLLPFAHRDEGEPPHRVVVVARHGAAAIERRAAAPIVVRDPPRGRYAPPLADFVEAIPRLPAG